MSDQPRKLVKLAFWLSAEGKRLTLSLADNTEPSYQFQVMLEFSEEDLNSDQRIEDVVEDSLTAMRVACCTAVKEHLRG